MNTAPVKIFQKMVCFFSLAFLLGVGSPFFPLALFDANAAGPEGIQPFDHGFHTTLERISPATLAYHRLKAVLSNHGNERAVPFVLPAVSHALSNPLSLPALARRLTDQTDHLVPNNASENLAVTPEGLLRNFVSAAATVFSLKIDLKDPIEFSPLGGEEPLPISRLMDRMAAEIVAADFLVKAAFFRHNT